MRILDNLYFRAEELGEVKIQHRLGMIFLTGDRVERDEERARYWLGRAAGNGHEEAARTLAELDGRAGGLAKAWTETGRELSGTESLETGLPPVIDPEIDADNTSDAPECPHGHGPLHDWGGSLRCWECGWPDEKPSPSPVPHPGSAAGGTGANLGAWVKDWFGQKPKPDAGDTDAAKDPKKGIGCDAVWVILGIIYLLTRSCS